MIAFHKAVVISETKIPSEGVRRGHGDKKNKKVTNNTYVENVKEESSEPNKQTKTKQKVNSLLSNFFPFLV